MCHECKLTIVYDCIRCLVSYERWGATVKITTKEGKEINSYLCDNCLRIVIGE